MKLATLEEIDGTPVIAIGMDSNEYRDLVLGGQPLIAEALGIKVFITCAEDEKDLREALDKANEVPSEQEQEREESTGNTD